MRHLDNVTRHCVIKKSQHVRFEDIFSNIHQKLEVSRCYSFVVVTENVS